MTSRERLDYARLVFSFALAGAVTVGTLMWVIPAQPPFDLRIVGAIAGALIGIKLLKPASGDFGN